jgi:predicted dienelactone hydrolase
MILRFLKVTGVAAALILGLIAAIVLALWVEHNQPVILPALTGPYPVGRAAFDWVDESRPEELAPETRAKRELTLWMWYPASIDKSSRPSRYEPRAWRVALARRQASLMNFLRHKAALVRTHSFNNLEVAPAQRTYPVILMKPGIGALALDYATLAEDLASDGYIVAASDSPYSTYLVVFQDGRVAERRPGGNPGENAPVSEKNRVANRVISTWVGDDRFLLDRLTQLNTSPGVFRGRLNLHAVGVMGHSFGGATAAEFCYEDPRCKAGIDIDGIPFGQVVHTSLDRPFMFLMSDHSRERDIESQKIKQEIQSIYERLPRGRLLVILRDSGHFSFSDDPLIFNSVLVRMSGMAGRINPARGLNAAAACIRAFFDVHLKGESPSPLPELQAEYPELTFVNGSKPVAAQM